MARRGRPVGAGGPDPRRRHDRQGDRRDPVAGRRQGLGAGRRSRQRARGRRRAGPPRGGGRGQCRSGCGAARSGTAGASAGRAADDAAAGAARRRRRRRVEAATPVARGSLGPPRPAGEKPIASPAVRRRAREAGVDLRQVRGSGPAGRISHDDLDAFLRSGAAGGAVRRRPRRAHRGRDRQGHRPAPAHRPEDGRVQAPRRALLLCRGDRRHRARGAAREAQRREPGPAAAHLDAVPDAGAGAGGRRLPRDERALRRRGRDHRAPCRRAYRHRDADAAGPDGAGGAPLRGARPVGLRRRGAAAGRGGAQRPGDARRAFAARPSPSPAWARSAASSPRR